MSQQTTVQTAIKPLNYKQLAAEYNVTPRTLKSWLKPFVNEIGQVLGKTLTMKQLHIIYSKLGEPPGRSA